MKRLTSLLTFSTVALLSAVSLAAPTAPKAKAKRTNTADVFGRLAEGKLEIPMRVTSGARLPVIGTTLLYGGEKGGPHLIEKCGKPKHFSLELHGIDFLEPDDGIADLARHQLEITRPLAQRVKILTNCVEKLKGQGYRFVSLREMAGEIA